MRTTFSIEVDKAIDLIEGQLIIKLRNKKTDNPKNTHKPQRSIIKVQKRKVAQRYRGNIRSLSKAFRKIVNLNESSTSNHNRSSRYLDSGTLIVEFYSLPSST